MGILNSALELQLLPPARGLRCSNVPGRKKEFLSLQVKGSLTHHPFPACEDDPELTAQPGPSPERDLSPIKLGSDELGLSSIPEISVPCPAMPAAPEAPVPPSAWHRAGTLPSPILSGDRDAAAPHPCLTPRQNYGIWGKNPLQQAKNVNSQAGSISQLSTAATTIRGETVEPGTTTDLGIPAAWREPPRILCSTTRTEQGTPRPPQALPWLLFQHILLEPD